MSDAIFCDNCNTVTRRGDVLSKNWVEVLRVGEPRQLGRRLLPESRRTGPDDPLGGGRHFCSLPCVHSWFEREVGPTAASGALAGEPVERPSDQQTDRVAPRQPERVAPRQPEREPAVAASVASPAATAGEDPGGGGEPKPARLSDLLAGMSPTTSLSDVAGPLVGEERGRLNPFRREPREERPGEG